MPGGRKYKKTRAKKTARKRTHADTQANTQKAVDDVTVDDMNAADVFLHKEEDSLGLPEASSLGPQEFSKIVYEQCNTSIIACNDRLKEYTGCDPEDISNCWNCIYPLTEDGYFCGLPWDKDDPKNTVLHKAIARLKELHPLTKDTFGVPVQRSSTGVIETQGSCCGRNHGGTG